MGRRYSMSVAQGDPRTVSFAGPSNPLPAAEANDPVTLGLRESARRMIGIAAFSGVINILTLSGSLYMLQVYDRVIPSRNIATLLGLSLIVLFAYLVQGYFDALRSRMLCRVATLFDVGLQESIHTALATLPLRGVKPVLMQQPLRDLDQVRADRVPRHAVDSDLSDCLISISPRHRNDGAVRHGCDHCNDAADRAPIARCSQGGDGL
jgi:ATP-binding cassette, subfamily C, bacterial PrsD